MQCLNPIWIKYPLHTFHERVQFLEDHELPWDSRMPFINGTYVPCGKCAACKERRKSEWLLRNCLEFISSNGAVFFTLTYDDEHVKYGLLENGIRYAKVCKRDIQLFLKRLRKSLGYKIRYFLISEYGPTTLRPHYHGIIYNINLSDIDKIAESWQNGFVRVDPVTHGRIAYCASYCFDDLDLPPGYEKNFMLCSRRPAIGSLEYLSGDFLKHLRSRSDHRFPLSNVGGETFFYRMPKYFKDRIFSAFERIATSFDSYERCNAKMDELVESQFNWCLHNRPDVLKGNYTTADFMQEFSCSPLDLKRQRGEEFTRKCLAKRKMSKKEL